MHRASIPQLNKPEVHLMSGEKVAYEAVSQQLYIHCPDTQVQCYLPLWQLLWGFGDFNNRSLSSHKDYYS